MTESCFNVTFSESENYAMSYVCVDVNTWIQNVCHERARVAKEEVLKIAIDKFIENKVDIPLSHDEIIVQAFKKGFIKSLKEIDEDKRMSYLVTPKLENTEI